MEYYYKGEWGQKILKILEERTSVNSDTGCWEWQGTINKEHGRIMIDGEMYYVHRLSAMLFLGYRPEYTYLQVLHKPECKVARCWNPDHLYVGTPADNVKDTVNAGTARGRFSDITHCINGHEYTEENTYHYQQRDGKTIRQCRICKKNRLIKFRPKNAS
jgi:hypothetical protein